VRKVAFLVTAILMGAGVVQSAGVHVGMPAAARSKGMLLESVSSPSMPTGPAGLHEKESGTFGTGSAVSIRGHEVEYRFDWGDGTYSSWSPGTHVTHGWTSAGTYTVKAQARCRTHPGAVSSWSSGLSESIAAETLSAPTTATGPVGGRPGQSYAYSTGGASSSSGHPVEYRFDWGDGSFSSWSASTGASHIWTSVETYRVKAQARCQRDAGAVSDWSSALPVGIFSTGYMVLISAGSFPMGDSFFSNAPVHGVYLDAYYIDEYEVTFDRYDAFCFSTGRTQPSDAGFGRGARPAINITWHDAKAYCEWAGKRLPTEAEWERAYRAGTDTAFYWGPDPGYTLMGNYAWYLSNSGSQTQPVGGKFPNAFGLYDMSGNVWEWVNDWYDSGYYAVSPSSNPLGPALGIEKILRGGSWNYSADNLRSAYRGYDSPGISYIGFGCRCAGTP